MYARTGRSCIINKRVASSRGLALFQLQRKGGGSRDLRGLFIGERRPSNSAYTLGSCVGVLHRVHRKWRMLCNKTSRKTLICTRLCRRLFRQFYSVDLQLGRNHSPQTLSLLGSYSICLYYTRMRNRVFHAVIQIKRL